MVGTFSYSANIAGAEGFLREAWPIIKQTAPNAKIQLVGKGLNKRTTQRWSGIPGVSVRGFVKDLTPLYQNCAMTISPILSGAGTNIKVLESAAYGRTPVISKVAQRGLETHFIHRNSCLVADTIAQMAAGCIELLANHELNHRIASKAYQEIQDHYTRKQFNIAVQTAIEKVTS
jgi:glycosyltransferase involved in cell wall biosynthesis